MSVKRFLNAGQNTANALKIAKNSSVCCGDGVEVCQYTASYPKANPLISITAENEDGADETLTFKTAIPANAGAAAVRDGIYAALKSIGGFDETDEFIGIKVVENGSNYDITIIGEIAIASLVHNVSTSVNFTEACEKVTTCTHELADFAGGASNTLDVNGISNSLGAITPGTTTAGAVKTALETALTNSGVSGVATVTTTGSGGSTKYQISIAAVNDGAGNSIFLNGVLVARTGCTTSFA